MHEQQFEEPKTLESKAYEKRHLEPYYYQKLSVKVAIIAIFTALAIGSSYALAPLINIEVMSVLLFLSGFIFGKYIGIFVGLISSAIYYGWNPFGVPVLPLYLVMIACMVFIGLIGGLMKSSKTQKEKIEISISSVAKFALIGFFFTFMFDIITNIVYAYFYYSGDIMLAFITGFPFMIVHIISNTVIFALLIIPVHNTLISF